MHKNKLLSTFSLISIIVLILVSLSSLALLFFSDNASNKLFPNYIRDIFHQDLSEKEAFTLVYEDKVWGDGSGIGSQPKNAIPYLDIQQQLLFDDKIQSIVDLGCGDWQLMKELTIPNNKSYIGYDLVETIIQENRRKFERKNIHFVQIDSLADLKNVTADLLILKDVMHHWPNQHIQYAIDSIIPNYKYALIINDYKPIAKNEDIEFGQFRPLDLSKSPFRLNNNYRVILDYPSHGIVKRIYFYTRSFEKSIKKEQ